MLVCCHLFERVAGRPAPPRQVTWAAKLAPQGPDPAAPLALAIFVILESFLRYARHACMARPLCLAWRHEVRQIIHSGRSMWHPDTGLQPSDGTCTPSWSCQCPLRSILHTGLPRVQEGRKSAADYLVSQFRLHRMRRRRSLLPALAVRHQCCCPTLGMSAAIANAAARARV